MPRHPYRSAALGLSLLLLLACGQGQSPNPATAPGGGSPPAASDGEVAATINGVDISVEELDDWIKEDLFNSRAGSAAKLHDLRSSALEEMIEERIVSIEATRAGMAPDQLIQREIAALGEVSDDEVKVFYAENSKQLGGAAYDDIKDQIRNFLASRRAGDAAGKLRERAEIVVFLEAPRFDVDPIGPSKGPANAPITIVEFSDFQCPYCSRALPIIQQVMEQYPEDVRVVYRHLPLERIHNRARPAAEASLCAEDQEKFWPYHDTLFANSRALERDDLVRYAEEVGLDKARFEKCLDEATFTDRIDADLAAARSVGITGTPAFVVNGVLLTGAKPASDFARVIDAELAKQPGKTGS